MSVVLLCLAAALPSAAMTWLCQRRPLLALWWFGSLTVFDTAMAALALVEARWALAAVFTACALAAAYEWRKHWRNRKRKRAAALAGAKSRARIAALVARVREAAKPRRVLRPVPGGAR